MSHGPLAYHITFHTYGTWLHGSDKGSVNRFNNEFCAPMNPDNTAREKLMVDRMKHKPLTLDELPMG